MNEVPDMPTSSHGALPNLFIPGAMKSGTTALAAALARHPDIFVIPIKEPMFFAQRPDSTEKLSELLSPVGPDWNSMTPHRLHDHLDIRTFAKAFAPGKHKRYRVDASTMYLCSPDAIEKARAAVPEAKFIAVLRDPYERAFSAFHYYQAHRREPETTFTQAILHERAGKRKDWAYGWRYFGTSLYADQIERLFAAVPEPDRLVMTMKDLVASDGLERVFAFLGLPSHGITLQPENRTLIPEGRVARAAVRLLNNHRIGSALRRSVPPGAMGPLLKVVRLLRNIAYTNGVPPPAMSDSEKAIMADAFEPDLDRLERLLQRDLSSWRYRPSTPERMEIARQATSCTS